MRGPKYDHDVTGLFYHIRDTVAMNGRTVFIMDNLETLTEIEEKVEKMIDDRENNLDELESQIEAEEDTIAAARVEMTEAIDAGDLTAYKEAKRLKADAEDARDMHEAQLNKLALTPAITAEEYAKLCADVTTAANQIAIDAAPELKEKTEELAAIGDQVQHAAHLATSILQQIQGGLYLNHDRPIDDDGGGYMEPPAEYRGAVNIIAWARSASECAVYKHYIRTTADNMDAADL